MSFSPPVSNFVLLLLSLFFFFPFSGPLDETILPKSVFFRRSAVRCISFSHSKKTSLLFLYPILYPSRTLGLSRCISIMVFFFLSHLRRTHFCISYCTISYNEKKKRNKNLRRRPPFLVLGYIALVCRRRVLHVSVVVVVVMKFSEERRIQECFLSTFFFS